MRTSPVYTASLVAAFTLGVTLALPVHANPTEPYYAVACHDDRETWTLAFNQHGTQAEFFKDQGRIRVGTYRQQGDDAFVRYTGGERPTRWLDREPAFILPPAPVVTARREPPTTGHPASPDKPQPAPGQMCDCEHNCYHAAGSTSAHPNSVPITVDGEQALAQVRVGRLSFNALIDSGASSLSLPETAGDELINSGGATEGEPSSVLHADGKSAQCRTIVVNSVNIGGHVVRNVRTVLEPDGSQPLLGFKVLQSITGRFTIDAANSTLEFN
jgi:gag-polyprotein putative aspartyl protease